MATPASRARVVLVPLAVALVSAACAAKLYVPPTGPGVPFAEAAAVWQTLTTSCRNANTFAAEIAISGSVGEERLPSFTAHGAVTRADDIYLEVRPLGRQVVHMAGRAGQAVFLLPRDERSLRGESRDIVEALTGLRWGPKDLLTVLSGCVTTPTGSVTGTSYGTRVAIELGGDARAFLRQRDGAWQLEGATRDGLLIEYRYQTEKFPSMVRVSSTAANITPLDIRFGVSQHNVNTDLPASAFVLEVPPNFVPITLAELRSNRPVRDGKDDK